MRYSYILVLVFYSSLMMHFPVFAVDDAQTSSLTKGIEVVPFNEHPSKVELNIWVEKAMDENHQYQVKQWQKIQPSETLSLNTRLKACVKSSLNGYISIWDGNANGGQKRIYPNPYSGKQLTYTEDKSAVWVQANQVYCVGDTPFYRYMTERPLGTTVVWVYWSETSEHRIKMNEKPRLTRLKGISIVPRPSSNPESKEEVKRENIREKPLDVYASQYTEFDISH